MALARRLLGSGAILTVVLALGSLTAEAGNGPSHSAKPPRVFQVSPTKINPRVQSNLMLAGQNLTPTTEVRIGGRTAQTVEASDGYHLLVKLPDGLPQGTYLVEALNEAGSATADERVVIQTDGDLNRSSLLAGTALASLVMLAARLARNSVLR